MINVTSQTKPNLKTLTNDKSWQKCIWQTLKYSTRMCHTAHLFMKHSPYCLTVIIRHIFLLCSDPTVFLHCTLHPMNSYVAFCWGLILVDIMDILQGYVCGTWYIHTQLYTTSEITMKNIGKHITRVINTTTPKQSTAKPCAYYMGLILHVSPTLVPQHPPRIYCMYHPTWCHNIPQGYTACITQLGPTTSPRDILNASPTLVPQHPSLPPHPIPTLYHPPWSHNIPQGYTACITHLGPTTSPKDILHVLPNLVPQHPPGIYWTHHPP